MIEEIVGAPVLGIQKKKTTGSDKDDQLLNGKKNAHIQNTHMYTSL